MKGKSVLVHACCPSEFIDNSHFHLQKWPGLDNVLRGHVSKGFILFLLLLLLLLFSWVGEARAHTLNPRAQWTMKTKEHFVADN